MIKETRTLTKSEEGELSFKDIILGFQEWVFFLLKNWLVILIIGLMGGVIGYLYTNAQKPIYTATTTFVLEEESGSAGLGSFSGLASIAGVDLGAGAGGIFQGDNIIELYKSRNMIQKTLLSKVGLDGKSILLIDRYIKFNKLNQSWKEKGISNQINFDSEIKNRVQDSVLGIIANDIDKNYLSVSKPNKKLSIIRADVKSIDEGFSKAFNDQIVKNVNDFYVQTKTKKSLDNVLILQQKVDSVRMAMNGSIYAAVLVSDQTPNLNPTRQVQRIAPAQKAQFSAETNKVILAELVKNLELSKITLRKEQPLIQIIDQPIFPLNKDKMSRAKGVIFGGLIAGFIVCVGLVVRKLLNQILSPE